MIQRGKRFEAHSYCKYVTLDGADEIFYGGRLQNKKIVGCYIQPFEDSAISKVAERISINRLGEWGVPLYNLNDGELIERFVSNVDPSKFDLIALNLIWRAINKLIAKMVTTEDNLKQTQINHVKIEKYLKIDPLCAFIAEIMKHEQNGAVEIEKIKGFSSIHYSNVLVECGVATKIHNKLIINKLLGYKHNSIPLEETEHVI